MSLLSNPNKPARFSFTLLRLSIADLYHEWILTTCMILALAAILAPILLMLGLKNGTIETLRNRLIENPVFRELRPQQTNNLSPDWFKTMKQRPEVAFIIPSILRGSSIVRLGKDKRGIFEGLDLVPTGDGDPLLVDNKTEIPGPNEIVLSSDAATRTGLSVGDDAYVRASRVFKGKRQQALAKTIVKAILPAGADGLPRVYAPLSLSTDIEAWREGSAVPNRNWTGSTPIPYLSFDGIIILSKKVISPILIQRLVLGSGYSNISEINSDHFYKLFGFAYPDNLYVWQLSVIKQPAQLSSIKSVRGKLRGLNTAILPYVNLGKMNVETISGKAVDINLAGFSPKKDELDLINQKNIWPEFFVQHPISGIESYKIRLPDLLMNKLEIKIGETVYLTITNTDNSENISNKKIPLTVVGKSIGKTALIPISLAARLRTGMLRKIIYDETSKSLNLARSGYRGFRIYARNIDVVSDLYMILLEQGINTTAKVESIERVKVLDRGLTRIFWLVAVVGIIGGFAALISNLYAAVERKKRELSLLRLMGLTRKDVFRYPVYQAAIMAFLGAIVAVSVFNLLAYIINSVFSGDLTFGEKICRLPPEILFIAVCLTVLAGIFSAIMAAFRATAIEPAEAIRVE